MLTGMVSDPSPKIENGVVTELGLNPDGVTDLSPLRALVGLKKLSCRGTAGKGTLTDLSPLAGLKLVEFDCIYTPLTDLAPLAGMPLTYLNASATVPDLKFLKGMPLKVLYLPDALDPDLSPLAGMRLERFQCYNTRVTDLTVLAGMPLVEVNCANTPVADLSPLASCKSLKTVDASKTNVTAATVAALKRALPDCDIKWSGGGAASSDLAASPGGYALEFDGVDDYVQLPKFADQKPFTVEAICTPSRHVHSQVVSSHGFYLSMGSKQPVWTLTGRVSNNQFVHIACPQEIKIGQRVTLAGVHDGQNLRLFVNGKLIGEQRSDAPQMPDRIGAVAGMLREFFPGTIESVRISRGARYKNDYSIAEPWQSDDSTLALYHFDEGSGDQLLDSSPNKHHGKIVGAKWVPGIAGEPASNPPSANPTQQSPSFALDFDGKSRVDIPSLSFESNAPLTWEATVLCGERNDGTAVLVLKSQNGYAKLQLNETHFLVYGPGLSGYEARGPAPEPGRLYRVAGVWDGTRLRLFVDGKEAKDLRASSASIGAPSAILGHWGRSSASEGFRGQLDEVRISNVARYTADYVPEDRLSSDEHTLALYHFDEGAGDQLLDSSPNKHHGKITGAKWVPGIAGGPGATTGSSNTVPPGDYALLFDGDDVVNLVKPLQYTPDSLTFEGFVRIDAYTPRAWIFTPSGNSGLGLDMQDGKYWRLSHVQQPSGHFSIANPAKPVELGRRVHLAAVCGPTHFTLYVDGKRVAQSGPRSGQQFPVTGVSKLGHLLRGLIDDVRISSKPRYDADFTPPLRHENDADTLALYHFDEGTGDTLRDDSGNGYDGKITGATWVQADGSPPNSGATAGSTSSAAWQPLFNGTNLEGWELHSGEQADWTVENGAVVRVGGTNDQWIRTTRTFRDFTLRLESRSAAPASSGIGLRNNVMQVDLQHPRNTGTFITFASDGAPIFVAPLLRDVWKTNEWNQWEITCRGKLITALINGQKVQEIDTASDKRFPSFPNEGAIYLEAGPGRVEFRNLEIRELDAQLAAADWQPLFDGQNLEKFHLDGPQYWKIEGGVLSGNLPEDQSSTSIYTRDQYGDFHLKLEAQHVPTHNGNLYCRVGDGNWKAYAATLTYKSGLPVGSVLSSVTNNALKPAERAPLTNGEWYTLEVIAQGSRITTLVNGQTVADYTDPDPAQHNSRGRILLQLKPGTLKVRKLEIRELNGPPTKSQTFGGHRYQFLPDKLSWTEAKLKAEQMGGHLATITSQEENDWIAATFIRPLPLGLGLWIGGQYGGSPRQWSWVTGEPFGFTQWHTGEPVNAPDEPALVFSLNEKGETGWGDINDTGITLKDRRAGLLVEWDTLLSPYEILTSPDYEWSPPENLGPTVNTTKDEGSPSLSADGLTLVFDSTRSGGPGNGDLWMCRRATPAASWSAAELIGSNVNNTSGERMPALSADGLTLLFASDRTLKPGQFLLWQTTRKSTAEPWSSTGRKLDAAVHVAGYSYGGPELSADGLTLFFYSSHREGGLGGDELWMTSRPTTNAAWGAAQNLGPGVNSSKGDASPTISSDGRVLVFASDRAGGRGAGDLWLSSRASVDAPWSAPQRLGSPVNTAGHEAGPSLSADGTTLYFNAERTDGLGGADLWMSRRVLKGAGNP
ncbi:MAG: family 16 glycoside hydrolase [Pirellulaceae bacterium]|nr:family 16 glycoside hydrolase [Pirellulaceae bacterium]